MRHQLRQRRAFSSIVATAVVVVASLCPWLGQTVHASSSLSNTYVRLSRMKANTATDFRLVFKTSATNGTEAKVKVQFYYASNPGTQFTVNTTQAVSSASCAAETGATALPGTLSASGDDTATIKTVTITGVSDLSTSTAYCVDLTTSNSVTTPNNAGAGYVAQVRTTTSADALIDDTNIGLRIVTDDQIVVTAVVPPSFNFVLSANTDAFVSNLDPATVVSTGGRTATVTTNAAKGWIAWVKDSNQGLTSVSAAHTIATAPDANSNAPEALTAGTEGYVLDVDLTTDFAGGGSVTIDPEYNGTTTSEGGTLFSSYKPIASASGTAGGDVITLIERAAIKGDTQAGNDYTDTLTVVAAGNF